jgi:hypothetical protein
MVSVVLSVYQTVHEIQKYAIPEQRILKRLEHLLTCIITAMKLSSWLHDSFPDKAFKTQAELDFPALVI